MIMVDRTRQCRPWLILRDRALRDRKNSREDDSLPHRPFAHIASTESSISAGERCIVAAVPMFLVKLRGDSAGMLGRRQA
ncbi:hypothetical protein [Bradyrhizobium tunisiense]|uniref:hypothetical protein n=1 Tax=Bradyrhizobium tunisiense TaxID=3278709 RepID=UPI0035D56625